MKHQRSVFCWLNPVMADLHVAELSPALCAELRALKPSDTKRFGSLTNVEVQDDEVTEELGTGRALKMFDFFFVAVSQNSDFTKMTIYMMNQ